MDEVWKNKAPTMPYHPYERAQARFWADYIHNNIPNFFGSFALIFTQFWWLLFKTLRLMFMLYFLLSSLNSVLGNLKLNFILSFLTSEIKFHPLFIISLPKEIYRRVLYCLVNYKLAK